jgi:hypothetical protein
MRVWIVAAAIAATVRSIDLCVSLFPLPMGEWLTAVAVQVAVLSALWIAVFAVRHHGLTTRASPEVPPAERPQ